MDQSEKIRENRVRRMVERRGYRLRKSRRRDPRAIDFGGYMILDPADFRRGGVVVAGGSPYFFSLTLDEVEQWLEPTRAERAMLDQIERQAEDEYITSIGGDPATE